MAKANYLLAAWEFFWHLAMWLIGSATKELCAPRFIMRYRGPWFWRPPIVGDCCGLKLKAALTGRLISTEYAWVMSMRSRALSQKNPRVVPWNTYSGASLPSFGEWHLSKANFCTVLDFAFSLAPLRDRRDFLTLGLCVGVVAPWVFRAPAVTSYT